MYRIKKVREAKNYTQKDLAQAAAISLNSVRRYEQGTRSPTAEVLCKLSTALGVTPNDLLLGVETPEGTEQPRNAGRVTKQPPEGGGSEGG